MGGNKMSEFFKGIVASLYKGAQIVKEKGVVDKVKDATKGISDRAKRALKAIAEAFNAQGVLCRATKEAYQGKNGFDGKAMDAKQKLCMLSQGYTPEQGAFDTSFGCMHTNGGDGEHLTRERFNPNGVQLK